MTGSNALFLALDQGGHSSRALVLDSVGHVVAKAQVSISTQTLSATRIEHSAEELAQSLTSCCDQIAETLGEDCARIESAGLATQRSSIVCWQRSSGTALTKVLSWQDRRAHRLVDKLNPQSSLVENLTGLVMSPHYGASKLRWCLDNEPSVQEARKAGDLTIGPLASYLLRTITQSPHDLCDPANASRTLLWNRHTRAWSKRLCNLFGVDRSLLPDSVPSRYVFGNLPIGNHHVPLKLVTGDQSAAIYAFGATHGDSMFINCGTGAFLQCPIGQNTADVDGLLNSVVYQDSKRIEYVLEGTVNGAGRALTWWSERCGQESKSLVARALERQQQDTQFSKGVPVFLNGISGLGAPYWRSDFESKFMPASSSTTAAITPDDDAGAVAIVDSIAFLLAKNVNRAAQHAKGVDQLVLTGGLASVNYLCQSLADISRVPTVRSRLREATAKGVGYLLSQDKQWPGAGQLTRFEPGHNGHLIARYERWQNGMKDALKR